MPFSEEEFTAIEGSDPVEDISPVKEPEPEQPQTDSNELNSECEDRLEMAMHYRMLLKSRFFEEESESSRMVEAEAKDFFRERLEALLGMKGQKSVSRIISPFSAQEVTVLKAVASKLIKKPGLVNTESNSCLSFKPDEVSFEIQLYEMLFLFL